MIAEINRSFATAGPRPLVADTGDYLFCSCEIEARVVLASASYATMGFGVPSGYNELAADRFAELVRIRGIATWRVETVEELRSSLAAARRHEAPAFIEVMLERGDISRTLATFTCSVGTTPPPL